MERTPKYAYQYYPRPLPIQETDSTIREWVDAHQDVYDELDDDIQSVVDSKFLTSAQENEINEKAKMLGILAKRNGRGDEEFRQFLYGLNGTFNGRGTKSGVRFAVGTGILASNPQEDIELVEHFDDKEYSIVIKDWRSHNVKTIYDLAELSDPVGVNLRRPVKYESDPCKVRADTYEVRPGLSVETPPHPVGITTPPSSTTKIRKDGFGSGRFDGDDPFGPGSDDPNPGEFETGDLRAWSNVSPAFGIATNRVRSGRYSGYAKDLGDRPGNTGMVASRNFDTPRKPDVITFSYNETEDSHGCGLRVMNNTGNEVVSVATDNPEYHLFDGNGLTRVKENFDNEYDVWVDVTIVPDWSNNTLRITWQREGQEPLVLEDIPMASSSGVGSLELWNYNSQEWGSGDIEAWFDSVTSIGGTEVEVLTGYNQGGYNEGKYNE